jgi:hypothetical protein
MDVAKYPKPMDVKLTREVYSNAYGEVLWPAMELQCLPAYVLLFPIRPCNAAKLCWAPER